MPTVPKAFRICQFCRVLKPCNAFQYKTIYCNQCREERGPFSERLRASQARYRDKHRELLKQRARERYRNDSRYGPEKQRSWRAENPESSRLHVKKYRIANPEMNRIQCANRRVRNLGAHGKWTREDWLSIKARQDFRCLMCGRHEPEIKLTADHVIPLSEGGSNYPDNLQGLCQPCNSRKHTKVIDLR